VNAVALPGSPLHRLASVVLALVRIDARRPASWLVAAATLAVVALAPTAGPWAAGGGVLLGIAAVGSLLRAPQTAEMLPARLLARLAWPLAAAAACAVWARLAGVDAAGRTLVAAGVTGGAILAVAAVCGVKRLPGDRHLFAAPPMTHDHAAPGPVPLVGRSWPDAAAMASTLVAMAVCYFLMPEFSACYAVVATSWFTLLAVPAATLIGGDQRSRNELTAAAPGRPRLPGTPAAAVLILAAYAAVLGWPAAVAAIVARDRPWGWHGPLAAMLMLALLAAVASALAWVSSVRRWRDDTTLALVASAHAVALALVARAA
jgi:hypothetical protein